MAFPLDYDYFLVCAFEFTCDGKRSQEPQEIIELCILKYCVKSQNVVDKLVTCLLFSLLASSKMSGNREEVTHVLTRNND